MGQCVELDYGSETSEEEIQELSCKQVRVDASPSFNQRGFLTSQSLYLFLEDFTPIHTVSAMAR